VGLALITLGSVESGGAVTWAVFLGALGVNGVGLALITLGRPRRLSLQ